MPILSKLVISFLLILNFKFHIVGISYFIILNFLNNFLELFLISPILDKSLIKINIYSKFSSFPVSDLFSVAQ